MAYEIVQIQTNLAGAYTQLRKQDDALNCLSDWGEVNLRRGILEKIDKLKARKRDEWTSNLFLPAQKAGVSGRNFSIGMNNYKG